MSVANQRADEHLIRVAFLVSAVGDWIYRFALPLMVLEMTGSALSTAIAYVVEFVPYILIGLVAGNVADRADRRRLLIVCDLTSAAIVAAIAVIAIGGTPPVALLYAVALLLASVRPFQFPAFQAFVVERVRAERRPTVNAWVQGTDSTLNLLGPVIGVAVVVWMGPAMACVVNAVSFALTALLVSRTDKIERAAGWLSGVWGNVRSDFLAGTRELIANAPLLWGTILMTVTNFALLSIEANLTFLVAGPDAGAGLALGLVFSAQGIGAVIGASIAPALIRRYRMGALLSTGMLLLTLAIGVPVFGSGLVPMIVAWLFAGAATSLIVVPWFTYRQEIVPDELIGRVSSVSRAVSYLTMPLGAVVGSLVVTNLGRTELFLIAALIQALVWIATMASPLGRARLQPALAPEAAT